MDFENVVDKVFEFFGVDGNTFKIGETVFEAMEDPDDGYRSYLGSVEKKDPSGLIFFQTALARVVVKKVVEDNFDGYELKDVEDGHVWLTLGTADLDDYYPSFIFQYQPKAA